jgi:UDP-2,4-diacetamido-2,4,6-trideoxy-beta-L-altropyranose hydrolase
MRSLTLAKRIRENKKDISICFASLPLLGNINEKIEDEGFRLYLLKSQKAEELISLSKELNVDMIIIDHYDINYEFETLLKKEDNLKIIAFDDTYEKHNVDLIINHGIQGERNKYPRNQEIIAGSNYTLIRDEFYQENIKRSKSINSIVIILGGADVNALSLKIVKLFRELEKNYKLKILTTSSNSNLPELKKSTKDFNFDLLIDSKNIAQELNNCDLVITSTSTSLYETIFLRKLYINISVASNQSPFEDYLEENNLNYNLSNFKSWRLRELLNKIEYNQEDIYNRLEEFKFSKYEIVKKILAI